MYKGINSWRAAEITGMVNHNESPEGLEGEELRLYNNLKKEFDKWKEKLGRDPILEVPYGVFEEPKVDIKFKD